MAMPAFEPAFELCWEMPSLSSSSASKFFFQRFFIAPTGVRLRRWLDKHYTDYYYRNHFIYIMDDTINDSQGRLSGGGMQTLSKTATTPGQDGDPAGPTGITDSGVYCQIE